MQKILQVGTAVQTFSARDALQGQVALLTPLASLTAKLRYLPCSQCFASIWFESGSEGDRV